MLHRRPLLLSLLLSGFSFLLLSIPVQIRSDAALRRLTATPEQTTSLNPSISGDGQYVAFESSEDLANAGGAASFRTFSAGLHVNPMIFKQLARTRAVAPSISQDGSRIAFASTEDLAGQNQDRNSEIFLVDGAAIRQITDTHADDVSTRTIDGNFQPSISDDGNLIAFSSNRNLLGSNSSRDFQIFVFNLSSNSLSQVSSASDGLSSSSAKISGDGSHIAYLREATADVPGRDLILYDVATRSGQTIIHDSISISFAYGRAISDDGTRIVYSAETGPGETQVFLFNARAGTSRAITNLPSRVDDVPLLPTISGDGRRISFATRRSVNGGNSDRSVELYLFDVPTATFTKLTSAPSKATAEVTSSLNDDGSIVVFNFSRLLSGPVSDDDFAGNCEIYSLTIAPRPPFGELEVLNAASMTNETSATRTLAADSIAVARGSALASNAFQPNKLRDGSFPHSLEGTVVTVNGIAAEMLYLSPAQISFVVPHETQSGQAEIVITNADGFSSRAFIAISSAAPGIFTLNGEGSGTAMALDADTFAAEPFDPTNANLRLTIFATGVRHASNVQVHVDGRSLIPESVTESADLPGLDEIHVLVPPDLRGEGDVSMTVEADDRESNPVLITFSGSALRDIVINEFLADPAAGNAGDANRDGVRDSADDEFVELVNTTTRDLNVGGFELVLQNLNSATAVLRHKFVPDTIFPAGTSIVIFGGGSPLGNNPLFGGAQIFKASTGSLSLLNSGSTIILKDVSGNVVTQQTYGGSTNLRGDANQSLTRSPDVSGSFSLHQTVGNGAPFSPGTRVDGSAFAPFPAVTRVVLSPVTANLSIGEITLFTAHAFGEDGSELPDILFKWNSTDQSVATIDAQGRARAVAAGRAEIFALARGVSSSNSSLLVTRPTATPTPIPTPSPVPSPSVSPTPGPTPTPSVSPPPSPSPTPLPVGEVVISEFRTRGPNGASDEFVELYNKTDAAVDLSGWKIRGSSGTGTITTKLTISSGSIIPARHHFVAVNSTGYSGTVSADQAYTSSIANDGGIALTLPNDVIVDQIGLSPGSAFKEGMHLAPLHLDADQSYERKPGGVSGSTQDTNDNFNDFQLLTPSDPQNRQSDPTPRPSPGPDPTPSPSITPSPTPVATPSPSPTPTPSPVPSPTPPPGDATVILISQVYGGGGNSGATFRNDFIELLNAGSTSVSLAGWSVQYASATGSSWTVTNLSSVVLPPGHYYLVQESSAGTNGNALPPPDASGNISMAASAGKVALVNSNSALSGACPAATSIVDLVGYGTSANCFRGTAPAAAPGNTTSIIRKENGCASTQNNSADFATGAPTPRNTVSTANICPRSPNSAKMNTANNLLWQDLRWLLFSALPSEREEIENWRPFALPQFMVQLRPAPLQLPP